jgi:phage-related protein
MLNKLKELFSKGWKELKKLFSSNFYIIKDGTIAFVGAVFKWLYNIIEGLVKISIKAISAISKLLLSCLSVIYTKLCSWISKW